MSRLPALAAGLLVPLLRREAVARERRMSRPGGSSAALTIPTVKARRRAAA